MPVRNAERSIELAIRTTLSALDTNDELIVGLHNCTDNSESLVNFLACLDSRLRVHVIRSKSFSEALNELIALANRPLIARMDADDICLPWRFRIQRAKFSDRNLDFIFGTAIIRFPLGRLRVLVPQYPLSLRLAQIRSLLRGVNPLVHPTMVGRTDSIKVLGGYRELPGEDLDLWLRAANADMELKRHWLPVVIYNLSLGQLSREVWYSNGWQSSALILEERKKLAVRIGNRRLTMLEKLEVVGFPLVGNFKRIRAFNNSVEGLG
jgi:glycosyltransferase involved in cell wall biosynthesis